MYIYIWHNIYISFTLYKNGGQKGLVETLYYGFKVFLTIQLALLIRSIFFIFIHKHHFTRVTYISMEGVHSLQQRNVWEKANYHLQN